ncbi:MAG: FG-GAP-like repeat-containing protein [Gemmataceae bacterium]
MLLLLLIGGGIAVFLLWPKDLVKPADDLAGAMAANQRGIGLIEQYEYARAAAEFEQAAKLAPGWSPARVNLAIALMNENTAESKKRAEALLEEILQRENDNKHAHFCMGILLNDRAKSKEAFVHFEAVNKLDPDDAHTWLRMGSTHPNGNDSPESRKCNEEALKRNPYLNAARYGLFLSLRADDPKRATEVLAEFEALKAADWEHQTKIVYTEMGKYADAIGSGEKAGNPEIGPLPVFEWMNDAQVKLASGAKWATDADLDPLHKTARARFGVPIVIFDFNRDDKPDLFLPAAVIQDGKLRDVLLKNEGNYTFTDVTAAAGLAKPRPSLGASAADYDNDGRIDLLITGAGEQHLFRNVGDGTFQDVSAAAGLDKVAGLCLGAAWSDLDQDGDLDLVLCRFSDSATSLDASAKPSGGLELFENIGEYPPGPPAASNGQPSLRGLTTKFRRDDRLAKLTGPVAAAFVVVSDLDNDHDPDILLLEDDGTKNVLSNNRLMRFERVSREWQTAKLGRTNGGLVLGANHDGRSDLFLLGDDGPKSFLSAKNGKDFEPAPVNSPKLKQALAADIDRDSWTDIVGLGTDGKPVLLHNLGDGKLEKSATGFGDIPVSLGIAVGNMGGTCSPDLVTLTETGLHFRRSLDNGNTAIRVEPTGRRKPKAQGLPGPERTNADGLGCRISVAAGALHPEAERTTASAGLGQSMQPTVLGIGKAGQAEFVRVHWPDMVFQTELGITGCAGVFKLAELERKPDSCPTLLTWDGEKFVFVTDMLGGGAIGELEADGSIRPPRPEESVKIEHFQMKPRNGRYLMKIAEPMDEVMYLDHLRLDVIDHHPDVHVHPDERFAIAPPFPTQELLAFKNRIAPKSARDHRGADHTKTLLERDRKTVEGFGLRSWLGFAEDHDLVMDFGTLPPQGDARWFLVLAGWTEYAYPESMYAAARAGIALNPPVLEILAADGKTWKPAGELGFPAGLPRVMTFPLGKLPPGNCTLRIRTNMQVYWDQIYLAPASDVAKDAKVHSLAPVAAALEYRGFVQEVYPDGKPPVSYDDAKTEAVTVNKWKGNLTRLGDVTDLLMSFDDRLAICGPGDEVTVEFDAAKLPPLPAGSTRSFVLRSSGYCKSTAPTTATACEVGPLPFKAMKNYPEFGTASPVTDAAKWHTRPASGR